MSKKNKVDRVTAVKAAVEAVDAVEITEPVSTQVADVARINATDEVLSEVVDAIESGRATENAAELVAEGAAKAAVDGALQDIKDLKEDLEEPDLLDASGTPLSTEFTLPEVGADYGNPVTGEIRRVTKVSRGMTAKLSVVEYKRVDLTTFVPKRRISGKRWNKWAETAHRLSEVAKT